MNGKLGIRSKPSCGHGDLGYSIMGRKVVGFLIFFFTGAFGIRPAAAALPGSGD